MSNEQKTMIHPFTGVLCDTKELGPQDVVEPGDIYRSATLIEEKSGLGKWFIAGDIIAGMKLGPECNVHMLRLSPVAGAAPSTLLDEPKPEKGYRGNRF